MAWYRCKPTAGTPSTLPFRSVDEQRITSQFQPGNVTYWRVRRWRKIVPQEGEVLGGQRRTVSIANGYWMMLDAKPSNQRRTPGPGRLYLGRSGFHRIGRTRITPNPGPSRCSGGSRLHEPATAGRPDRHRLVEHQTRRAALPLQREAGRAVPGHGRTWAEFSERSWEARPSATGRSGPRTDGSSPSMISSLITLLGPSAGKDQSDPAIPLAVYEWIRDRED